MSNIDAALISPGTARFKQRVGRPVARNILIVLMGVIYSGLLPYLAYVSVYILYALYVVIIGLISVCLLRNRRAINQVSSITLYFSWIAYYMFFGMLVSPQKAQVLSDLNRLLVQSILVYGAFTICIWKKSHIELFCNAIQVVLLINLSISIWEAIHPDVVSQLAHMLNSDASTFDELRPAALWSNPNEASFAFLFGLLLSYWASKPLAWLGRLAGVGGIYLTVSRSGTYLLLMCVLIYCLFKLRSMRNSLGCAVILVNALTLLTGVCLYLSYQPLIGNIDLSNSWNIGRIIDFSESNSTQETRVQVAAIAAKYALNGPWYGYGIFTFQGIDSINTPFKSILSVGAHNIYITVFGEIGVISLFIYLLVLFAGILRTIKAKISLAERAIFISMWLSYLFIGLVWHNQFTSVTGMVYIAIMYHLPVALAKANMSVEGLSARSLALGNTSWRSLK